MSRTGMKKRRSCPTGKIRYRDGDQAGLALKGLRARAAWANLRGGEHRIRVLRKYECPMCGGWHLTSQPDVMWVVP